MKDQQKEIIESYIKSYNSFDIPGMIKNLDENVVFENVSYGTVDLRTDGVDAFKQQAEAATGYFSSRTQTVEEWDFNENSVTVKIDYSAVLKIDLPNGMKAGDTLNLKGESLFEFNDDKIVKIVDKS